MKKCYYCTKPIKKKEVHFWTLPFFGMDTSRAVCDKCGIRIEPKLLTEITGFIGVKI